MAVNKRPVFIVDDDEDDRTILRDAFLENGFPDNFLLIQSGAKLMDCLHDAAVMPALIIIDLHMPGKNGREIITELKTDVIFKSIPVVLFSTGIMGDTKYQLLQLGANSVVMKPNTYDEILVVTKCIGLLWNL